MAISTSPYQQNDYQAASSFRPYELPVNDIFKAISAQNQFWDEGARRVKSYYETALGLDLTLDENNETRKKFMQEAEKQMSKLSTMNLADPTVQREGLKIFKPLLNDKSIMLDNELTKLRNSIVRDAQGYKRRRLSDDGPEGEGYSDINLMDALEGFENFNSKTPRDEKTLEELYGKLKGKTYVPYYDFTKDMKEALTNCKGGENENFVAEGLNDRVIKTSGISAIQAKMCVESALAQNNKAMEQIGINARMNYKGNREALAQRVSPYLEQEVKNNQEMLTHLQAERLAKVNSKKATPEEIEQYDKTIKSYTESLENAKKNYEKFAKGDYSDLDNNYNYWAQKIYKKDTIENYSTPRATLSRSETLKANMGRITEYKEKAANDRLLVEMTHDKEMENLRTENDKELKLLEIALSDNGKKLPLGVRQRILASFGIDATAETMQYLGKGEEVDPVTVTEVKGKIDASHKESYAALRDMTQVMLSIDGATSMVEALQSLPANPNQADYLKVMAVANTYLEERAKKLGGTDKLSGKDAQLLQTINRYKEQVAYNQNLIGILNEATSSVTSTKEGKEIKKKYDEGVANIRRNAKDYVTSEGQVINKDRFISILEGADSEYKVELTLNPVAETDIGSYEIVRKSDGKKVFFKPTWSRGEYTPFDLARQYKNLEESKDGSYVKKINEKLSKHKVINRFVNKADEYVDEVVADNVNRLMKGVTSDVKIKANTVDYSTGEVTFTVEKDKKVIEIKNLSQLQDELGESFASEGSLFVEKNGVVKMKIPSLQTVKRSVLDEAIDLRKEALEAKATATGRPASQWVYSSRKGKQYILEATPMSTGTVYTIKGKDPNKGTYETIEGYENLSKDAVNAAIEDIKNFDYKPNIKARN